MTIFYEILFQYCTDILLELLYGSIQNWTIERITLRLPSPSSPAPLDSNHANDAVNLEKEQAIEEEEDLPEIQLRVLDPQSQRLIHCPFRLEKETKVSSIKSILAERLLRQQKQQPPSHNQQMSSCASNPDSVNLAVIFMGKELDDDFNIGSCDLGNDSILDVLRIPSNNACSPFKSQLDESSSSVHDAVNTFIDRLSTLDGDSLNQSRESTFPEEASTSVSNAVQTKNCHSFFVYCEHCSSLQNGKLRVCCAQCESGTILFQNEPENWDDLLTSDRIKCHCYTPGCGGTTARFYFKCAKNHSHSVREDDSGKVIPLNRIKINNIGATCIVCYSTDEEQMIVFPGCNHGVCLRCFIFYVQSSLWGGTFRFFPDNPSLDYTLDCPLHCEDSWIEASHLRIIEERFYSFYVRYRIEEIAFQNGGVVCVHEKCNQVFYPKPGVEKCEIEQCPNCCSLHCLRCAFKTAPLVDRQCSLFDEIETHNLAILRSCSQESNENSSSYLQTLIQKLLPILGDESASKPSWQESLSKATISEIAKRCPKCGTPIERNGGCMHMICTQRRCGFEWCWLCESQWTPDCQKTHWFF